MKAPTSPGTPPTRYPIAPPTSSIAAVRIAPYRSARVIMPYGL